MKKLFIIILYFFIGIQLISAKDLFRVLEDTPAWRNVQTKTDSNVARIIPKGSIISNVSRPSPNIINGILAFVSGISFENIEYDIPANTFTAIENEELFDESFLTNADPQAMIWVNTYFLDALRTGDRNVLIPYEQRLVEEFRNYEYEKWYEFGSFEESLVITQGTISIGGLFRDQFWIRQINRITNEYRVTVTWNIRSRSYYEDSKYRRSMAINLPTWDTTPVFYLYFIVDGDYLDVYYSTNLSSSERIYSATFSLIDPEMRKQLFNIIRFNPNPGDPDPFDPSKITFWPRRADGTMDYPPPVVSSNAPVQQVVDESIEITYDVEDQESAVIQQNDDVPPMPFWLWFAIIGGVVVAGVVLLAVVKRKG